LDERAKGVVITTCGRVELHGENNASTSRGHRELQNKNITFFSVAKQYIKMEIKTRPGGKSTQRSIKRNRDSWKFVRLHSMAFQHPLGNVAYSRRSPRADSGMVVPDNRKRISIDESI
jgi:hypothetical protein